MGKSRKRKLNRFLCHIMPLVMLLWGTAAAAGGCLFTEKTEMDISVIEPVHMKAASRLDENWVLTPEAWVKETLQTMTLEEKVGQMFFVTPGSLVNPTTKAANQFTQATDGMLSSIDTYAPGGIILMSGNIENDAQVTELIKACQERTKLSLFVGVDEEGGIVSRLGGCAGISMENVGPMQDIGMTGDPEQAYEVGKTLAEGLQRYGFNLDFAPDADVLTNPQNYEIGNRSFGNDASLVAQMVGEEVRGLQEQGVSAVAKHFPGHGAVSGNTHKNLQQVDTTLEEMEAVEFLPFEKAIEEDVDAILISHLALSEVNPAEPSTLSKEVVTGYLREKLGYQGVVITDSFQMGSITKNYSQEEAAQKAVLAGCDMILMPQDYNACYQGILNAVAEGQISEERIEESCRRILLAKIKRGILIPE